jgi:hypothetical protein
LAEDAEQISRGSAPVRELVISIPAPRGDHGKNEPAAIVDQSSIRACIAVADIFWHVGEIKLDRPTTARLQVYETRAVCRVEHIAGVRFAVQQLLAGAALKNGAPQARQRAAEKLSVRIGKRRSMFVARHKLLSLGHSLREVRRRHIELTHARMHPRERRCIVVR